MTEWWSGGGVPLTLPHDTLGARLVPRGERGITAPCDGGTPGCTARVDDTALRAAKAFAEMDAVDFWRAVARIEDQGQEEA